MNEISQVQFFIAELLGMIDRGERISIQQLEKLADEHNIINYIRGTFGFKNSEFTSEIQSAVSILIDDLYISEQDAQKYMISNNGLAYLAAKFVESLSLIAFDNKCNFELKD